jgi:plasmid stabilization system protein ParE
MRQVRFTREAEETFTSQITYLIDQGAVEPARALKMRVEGFLANTLAVHPRNGSLIKLRSMWETWIPGTRLVIWYTFTDEELVIITFWHTSQNREQNR